jgi:hypothetical protein
MVGDDANPRSSGDSRTQSLTVQALPVPPRPRAMGRAVHLLFRECTPVVGLAVS